MEVLNTALYHTKACLGFSSKHEKVDIPDFSNLEPHEEKASQEETIDQLTEDRKKVEELGYETICRLYRLANCLKENGYIGG